MYEHNMRLNGLHAVDIRPDRQCDKLVNLDRWPTGPLSGSSLANPIKLAITLFLHQLDQSEQQRLQRLYKQDY